MRFILTLLSLYLAAGNACRITIDINASSGSKPPEPFIMSYSAPPQASFDAPPVPPALSLQLVEAGELTNRKLGLLDVRLYNLSNHGIKVPISGDGKKAYELCGTRPLLKSTISWAKSGGGSGIQQAETDLYGCDFFEGSTLTLKTGEWITIAGLSFAKQVRASDPEGALTYSLDEVQYSYVGNRVKVVSNGLYSIRSAGKTATN